ncbi:unnamed protein product [Arctia plantaginis]|uniref:Uncharacterized protein n=1 Tax=Arctia plantaginis TaxID=874455 RepID=A0A8S1BX63_ARCPL|nr:unnamed protein product [Arctia plantaginis]
MRTEHPDQVSFCPFTLREVSVLAELTLGHLRYSLTGVPPQSNSPPGTVLEPNHVEAMSVSLGSTNSRATTVHAKPFSTSVLQGLTGVFATTTKICTNGGSRQAHAQTLLRSPSRTSYSLRPNNESLRSSIQVSPDFDLTRHSSPSFGSQHVYSERACNHRLEMRRLESARGRSRSTLHPP